MTASHGLRMIAFLVLGISLAGMTTGCAVDEAATPDAEMSAAVKTRDDAKVIQADTKRRVNDANAVLDGR